MQKEAEVVMVITERRAVADDVGSDVVSNEGQRLYKKTHP